jgi:hypothetical protein
MTGEEMDDDTLSDGRNSFFISRIHHVALDHNYQDYHGPHVNIRGDSLEPYVNTPQKASECLVVVVDKFTYHLRCLYNHVCLKGHHTRNLDHHDHDPHRISP